MSIIYSYPEQGALNANDLLIGTSAEKVGGKQKNITRNFSIQQIADFINRGAGFVDPVASDFQIPVFNQEGKKITGSIMSQDSSPSNGAAGSAITIAGSLVTTGDLTSPGVVTIGGGTNLITLNSETYLKGSLRDSANVLGADKQILLSDQFGYTTWTNYEAGLTYEGTWDANANTTNGLSNSPALLQGAGVSGHFYIVNVEGTTSLGPGLNDWHVGDWAIFLDEGGQPASWQKIDNTSTLVGSGTAGTFAKWTNATTLNDSIMSESGTVVSVDGDLKVKDTIQATTGPSSSLKLKGVGTGGVEIMSADGVTDGKITLNCSQNSHGVTLQSPPHASGATYTLILPTSFGGAGDVLTSAGANPSQLVWTTPTTGTVTGTGTENYVTKWSAGGAGIENSTIFDNGTNVGIGTTNPDSKLHVYGVGTGSGTYGAEITIGKNNGPKISSTQEQTDNDYQGLAFFTKNSNPSSDPSTERMRIASDGNVGIGTTSPTANLEINTGSTSSVNITSQLNGSIAFGNVSGSSQAPVIVGKSSSNNSPLTFIGAATNANTNGDVVFNARENNNSTFATLTNPAFKFQHYTTDLVTILRSGNVGIGTSSPSAKLEVAGDILSTGDITIDNSTGDPFLKLKTNAQEYVIRIDQSDAEKFQIRDITNSLTPFTIDSSGNVGIGTASPSEKLDVTGNISLAGSVIHVGDTNTSFGFHGNDLFRVVTGGTERFEVSNSGIIINDGGSDYDFRVESDNNASMLFVDGGNDRVGIGTSSPAVSLDISATDAVQMPVGITTDRPLTGVSNGMLRYNSTNNEFEGYINGNWGSIGGGAAGGLIFRGTFDASTGAIASGGSLYTCPAGGSGGTVDTAIGDLYIVTTAGSFFCSGTSLNVGDEVICITAATATNDNVNNWNAIASGAGGAVTGSGTTNYVPKFTGATVVGNSSIFNDASGNVGIGTSSPNGKLEVDLGGDGIISQFVGASSDTLNITGQNNEILLDTRNTSNGLAFGIQGSTKMVLNASGNVGIGTANPGAKLHTLATGGTTPPALGSSPDTAMLGGGLFGTLFSTLSSGKGVIQQGRTDGTATAYDLLLQPSGGNVGIGTTSPDSLLQVGANLASDGVAYISDYNPSFATNFFYRNQTAAQSTVPMMLVRQTNTGDDQPVLVLDQDGTGDILQAFTDTSQVVTIDNSGNVGIGTSTPSTKLQISATMTSSPTSNIFLDVDGNNVQGGGGSIVFGTSASAGTTNQYNAKITGTRSDSNGSSDLSFFTTDQQSSINSALRMIIKDSGRVGIGTDSPEVSLDLGNNTDAIRVPNGAQADRPSGILPGMIRYNTSSNEFEGYSGTLNVSGSWGALGGGSLPTKTVDTFTGSGQSFIDLTVEASSVNYIDMYIDGVYQAKATYTIATPGGTGISRLTLVSGTFPTGVSIETVTTT